MALGGVPTAPPKGCNPMMLLEYAQDEEGRRVIQSIVEDKLADLPFTAQTYLDCPDQVERVVGVVCEAALGGDERRYITAFVQGRFEAEARGEPMRLDDEDLEGLAEAVRPALLRALTRPL